MDLKIQKMIKAMDERKRKLNLTNGVTAIQNYLQETVVSNSDRRSLQDEQKMEEEIVLKPINEINRDQQQSETIQNNKVRGIQNYGSTCFLNSFFQLFSQMDYEDIQIVFQNDPDCIEVFDFITCRKQTDPKQNVQNVMQKYKIQYSPQDVLDVIDKMYDIIFNCKNIHIKNYFTTFQNRNMQDSFNVNLENNFIFYYNLEGMNGNFDLQNEIIEKNEQIEGLDKNKVLQITQMQQKIQYQKYLAVFLFSQNGGIKCQPDLQLGEGNKYNLLSMALLCPGHWVSIKFVDNEVYFVNDQSVSKKQIGSLQDVQNMIGGFQGIWLLYQRQ